MGILDQIKEMRNQGISNQEIVNRLQEQGISPKEISDALDQSRIKQAVTNEEYERAPSPEGEYTPQAQEMPQTSEYSQDQYAQPQQYYQDQYGYGGGTDSNVIIEIAEQVFSEKIKKIQKQVSEISEFKALTETKVENMSERLKRIEATIDKLQMAILNKVGTYGDTLSSIKKEMSMMQNSFGKVVNQAVRGSKSSIKTSSKKKSKKKSSKK